MVLFSLLRYVRFVFCALCFTIPLALSTTALAQQAEGDRPSVSHDLAIDLRARIGDSQHASSELHGGYFFLRTDNIPSNAIHVNLAGIEQYHAYRWLQANVEADLNWHLSASDGDFTAQPLRLQGGVIRLPFGIYDYRETYASGLINYPLARSDYAFSGVDWSVPGFQATSGVGNYQVETALFNGKGTGLWDNFNGIDGTVVRLQTYAPPGVIVGVSGWSGHQALMPTSPSRRTVSLGGLDLRYTRSHLIVRGEAIAGTLAGDTTRGGYLDAYYRLPGIEVVTLVSRIEALKPTSSLPTARQLTLGARYTLSPEWTLSGNYLLNNIAHAYTATWTTPTRGDGALQFQLLRRF